MTTPEYARKVTLDRFDPFRGKKPLLGHLDIELTERCNNRCIHCLINRPEDDTDARLKEMDTAFVLSLLDQATDLECLSVRFTGGEPLLRPDFNELFIAAKKLGMQVVIFTNARLITPELAELFSRLPPGRMVEVSVFGMHPESYDSVTGVKGAYEEFRRGVELLREYNIPFIVKQALLPQNRHEKAEFEEWVMNDLHMEKKPDYAMNFDLRTRRDDPARIAGSQRSAYRPRRPCYPRRGSMYVSSMQEFCRKFIRPPGDRLFNCGAGHGVCVDAYGVAQMCLSLRHPDTVFDLRKGSLRDALTVSAVRNQTIKNADYLKRCAQCFLMGLCEQCPAKSWSEHGTLDSPVEYFCEVAHAQARHLGLIGESEHGWEIHDWKNRLADFSSKR